MRQWFAAACALLLAFACVAHAADNPQFHIRPVDDAWRAALPHDAEAATQAYMDRLPKDVVARADAYFEGGYWLLLWNFVAGLVVAGLMLGGRRSARARDWALRVGRGRLRGEGIYGALYWAATWALLMPLAIYQGFVREHQYGMATQGFGAWFAEQLIALGVGAVVAALATPILYALLRRFEARWWVAGAAFASLFQAVALVLAPLVVDPLFNTYKPVDDPAIKASVLSMAHANGVPADNIYEYDASRQTTRVGANVTGIFGTAAVHLNDNLLRRTSVPEIRAVLGHELGHYVLNHEYKNLLFIVLVVFVGFAFADRLMAWALRRWGARWGLGGVSDVASLPLLVAVLSVFLFLVTPVFNTWIRAQEVEADYFGLNLSREPLGMAEVDLKLTEYRKPDPGPVEEFIFFDHPSTRHRVRESMQWRQAMQADGPDKPWAAANK